MYMILVLYKECPKLSSKIYRFLMDDVMLVHNKYLKWAMEIGTDFCESLVDFGKETFKTSTTWQTSQKYRSFPV